MSSLGERTAEFCRRFQLRVPIVLAPMAGVPAPQLSIAVAQAGALGACGVLLMSPDEILSWANAVRGSGPFQLNNWIPDPTPTRDTARESAVREFLAEWGPPVPARAGDAGLPDFTAQCEGSRSAASPGSLR
jgi:nitronate monooxygenase